MKKLLLVFGLLLFAGVASAQQVVLPCAKVGQTSCAPVSTTSPFPVIVTGGSLGTNNVNITGINSAAPSLTNPLWVSPATGSTFPVSGTVTTTPSGTQTVTGTVTLGAGAAAVGTVTAVGNVANGAVDSGNPLKTGGVYNTSLPTATSGNRYDVQLDSNARLRTNTAGAIYSTLQVSVGTTSTQVSPGAASIVSQRITNLGTVDVFCGPSGVTTTTGELLAGVKGTTLTFPTQAAIYCVVGTGTQTVSLALF